MAEKRRAPQGYFSATILWFVVTLVAYCVVVFGNFDLPGYAIVIPWFLALTLGRGLRASKLAASLRYGRPVTSRRYVWQMNILGWIVLAIAVYLGVRNWRQLGCLVLLTLWLGAAMEAGEQWWRRIRYELADAAERRRRPNP